MKKIIVSTLFTLVSFIFALSADEYLFFSPQMISTHLKGYSEEELAAIERDLSVVRSVCLPEVQYKSKKPIYLATAGAPGSRKTTILERFLHNHPALEFAYLEPDTRTLKFMVHTYYSKSLSPFELAEYNNYSLAIKSAYEKWRGASNYISLILLEESFSQKRNIAHGITSTGGHIGSFLEKIKNANYEIVLLLCSCEDDLRQKAIKYRNDEQKFYQSSPEDAISKGKIFPQRIKIYFTWADTLYLFWSDDLFTKERLAAVFDKGNIEIRDSEALKLFIQKYETDRSFLSCEGTQIPSWPELIDAYSQRSW